MKITKQDVAQLYQLASIAEMYAETMVEKAERMELGLDAKAKMAEWRGVSGKAAAWQKKFEAMVFQED